MGVEKLTSAIIESAQKKAQEIIAQGEEEIKKIEAYYNAEISKLITEYETHLKEKVAQLQKQILTDAKLRHQEEILKAQWQIIDESFNVAYGRFINSSDYYKILVNLIEKHADDKDSIIVASRDCPKLKLLVSHQNLVEDNSISAGIIIRKPHYQLNYTLPIIIERLKKELLSEIAHELFE
jgi:vacuolar-type H+-ATPase subunit E/Vma4